MDYITSLHFIFSDNNSELMSSDSLSLSSRIQDLTEYVNMKISKQMKGPKLL